MSNIDSSSPSAALGVQGGNPSDAVGQIYGYLAWAMNDPEIAKILNDAAAAAAAGVGWSQAQMDAALQPTHWWQTNSASARAFEEQLANDPATVNQQVGQKISDITNQLQQQGVQVDPSRLHDIAMDSLRFNWNDVQMKAALDSELMREPSILNSQVGTNYKALSRQYAVNLSDDTIQQWAAHSVSGTRSDDMFRQYLQQMSKSMFQNNADLTKFIDAGGTVSQFADPFKQDAATLLGIDPNQIDFSDPKWMAALNSQQVDANGKPVGSVGPMTRQQWIQHMKDDPTFGYRTTPNGINDYSDLAANLSQIMGGLPGAGGK